MGLVAIGVFAAAAVFVARETTHSGPQFETSNQTEAFALSDVPASTATATPSATRSLAPRAPLDPTASPTPPTWGLLRGNEVFDDDAGERTAVLSPASEAAEEAAAAAIDVATPTPEPIAPTLAAPTPTAFVPAPTATSLPPTATLVPPTPVPPTPVPPTATPTVPPPTATSAPLPPAAALGGLEAQMYASHNQLRAANGLGAFQLDGTLVAAARHRAQDMAARGYFDHTSPTGETAFSVLGAYGYTYALAGENIARNNYPEGQSVGVAMDGFMRSQGHRANILEAQFTRIGIGVARDGSGMIYFAVVFAN